MRSDVQVLERAITDTGHWRWWTTVPPTDIQLEFGGVQLHCPSDGPKDPPSSLIAVRLVRPRTVLFLAESDEASDWFDAMHRDELPPLHVGCQAFTLSSEAVARDVLAARPRVHAAVGRASEVSVPPGMAVVAFLAGQFGFYGVAESLRVLNMRGELSPDGVAAANDQWWRYWREYWQRKETPAPLPYDPTCEVTIPAAAD